MKKPSLEEFKLPSLEEIDQEQKDREQHYGVMAIATILTCCRLFSDGSHDTNISIQMAKDIWNGSNPRTQTSA